MYRFNQIPALLVFVLVMSVPDAFAAKPDVSIDKTKAPVIHEVSIDFVASEIMLTGFNFLPDTDDPVVFFGADPSPLIIISVTDTFLTVPLPLGTTDGDYMLTILNSDKEQTALDLTVDQELSEAEVIAYVDSNGYVSGPHYTDAEAIAAVGPHYTDAQAIAAVGPHLTVTQVEVIFASSISSLETAVADLQTLVANQQTVIVALETELSNTGLNVTALQTDFGGHVGNSAAHHIRYEDAEAVTAVGPLFSGDHADLTNVTTDQHHANLADSVMFDLEPFVSVTTDTLNGVLGPHVVFEGANVHVRSGLGVTTDGTTGLGNLIVGYNEDTGISFPRTGAHNLVLGNRNGFSSYGGLVAGEINWISSAWATITGGQWNEARGHHSSISGGNDNVTTGYSSSVSGGFVNHATDFAASVSGGRGNLASGGQSTVSGGTSNRATGADSAVSGGANNIASGLAAIVAGGQFNESSAQHSSVTGGRNNLANVSGWYASIAGGDGNETGGIAAHISGGLSNKGWGDMSTVSGGENNIAGHNMTVVSGGKDILAANQYDWVAADVMPRLAITEVNVTTLQTQFGTHAGNAVAHHPRYENAEAIAAVGPHYTDAEAIAAVGPHFSGDHADLVNVTSDQHHADMADSPVFDLEPFVSVEYGNLNALSGPHILFEGANIHVRSGSGLTDDGNDGTGSYYGLGNIIVGYNEYCRGDRTGSHNVVIGTAHQYTSYGGFVAGHRNQLHGVSGSVVGGFENTVTGYMSSVMGGQFNTAAGHATAVLGGKFNYTDNNFSTISGGTENQTNGTFSSVSGGYQNTVNGFYSSAIGGQNNVASAHASVVIGGKQNIASGHASVVIAGEFNESFGDRSAVVSGQGNTARGLRTAIFGGAINTTSTSAEDSATVGGRQNQANGWFSTVTGGEGNVSEAWGSSVSGGGWRVATDQYDWVAGTLEEDH